MTSTTADAFDRSARHYDLLVGLNPGYHHEQRRAARALVSRLPRAGALRLLDLACGSGASTAALVEALAEYRGLRRSRHHEPPALPTGVSLVGVDASDGMLHEARTKHWPAGVSFRHGVVGQLAATLEEESTSPDVTSPDAAPLAPDHDGVLACYLFRNVPAAQRDQAIAEVFGLLRPGGWLVVQEYSVPRRRARWIWTLVSWGLIIPLGLLVDHDHRLHRYLWRSVLEFETITTFADRLAAAGFTEIAHRTATGWQRGILHTVVARRPEES